MEVVESSSNLVRQLLGSGFTDLEVPPFKVGEEVTSLKILHHDVDEVLVLEYIQESDDEWMLAHLENLNLSSLKLNVLNCHIFFSHNLDSNFFASLLMDSCFYQAKLSFA